MMRRGGSEVCSLAKARLIFNEPFEGVGHSAAYARLGGLEGGRLLWRRALERPDDVVPVARPCRMLPVQQRLVDLGDRESAMCNARWVWARAAKEDGKQNKKGQGRVVRKMRGPFLSPRSGAKSYRLSVQVTSEFPSPLTSISPRQPHNLFTNYLGTEGTYISPTGTGFQASRRRHWSFEMNLTAQCLLKRPDHAARRSRPLIR